MENDDQPIGRILSRREALALFGLTGAALLAACTGLGGKEPSGGAAASATPTRPATQPGLPNTGGAASGAASGATSAAAAAVAVPTCVVRPAQTEGPYFVDEMLNRSDIRSDPSDGTVKEGVPLQLAIRVSQIGKNACTPLAGAWVDIWHCDALGVYSDVRDPNGSSVGKKFLRGAQTTDANGLVQFTTIYPGWYAGRTVHIHFKIRTDPASNHGTEFTSQLYFEDALSDQVFSQAPYSSKGQRQVRNAEDGIYRNGGDQLLLTVSPASGQEGYTTSFDIGLQLE